MTSAIHNIGTASLLTFLADVFPHPDEHAQVASRSPAARATASSASTTTASRFPSLYSKRFPDPFTGRINYFKIKKRCLEK